VQAQTHKVARNSLINGIAFAINAVIGFVSVSLAVRLYGIETQGLIAFGKLLTTAGYLSLFSLGLPSILTRKIAHHQGRQESESSLDWIAAGSRLLFFVGLALSLSLLVLFFSDQVRQSFLEVTGFSIVPAAEQANLILVLALTIPVQFVALGSQASLFGAQDFASIRSSEISSSFLNLIFLLAFWWAGVPGEKLVLTVVISETVKSLYMIYRLHRIFPLQRWVLRKFSSLRPELWAEIKVGYSSSIMGFLDTTAAPYVAMRVLGVSGLGVYDSLSKLARVVKTAFGLFNSSILPHAISVEAKKGQTIVSQLFVKASFLVAFFIVPGFAVLMGLSPWILKLWLGSEFSSFWQELNIGYVTVFASIFIGLQGSIFSSRRETIAKMTVINFTENLIGLPLLYWMSLQYGVMGLFLNRLFVTWAGWIPRTWVVVQSYDFKAMNYLKVFRWTVPIGIFLGFTILSLSRVNLHPLLVFLTAGLLLLPAWGIIFFLSSADEKSIVQRTWNEIMILSRLKKKV
jgi:O-antigen/teichoic acid export membrane protein